MMKKYAFETPWKHELTPAEAMQNARETDVLATYFHRWKYQARPNPRDKWGMALDKEKMRMERASSTEYATGLGALNGSYRW